MSAAPALPAHSVVVALAQAIASEGGRVLLVGDLEPPPRSLPEVIFPLRRPEAAGRKWCQKIWNDTISLVLVPRG